MVLYKNVYTKTLSRDFIPERWIEFNRFAYTHKVVNENYKFILVNINCFFYWLNICLVIVYVCYVFSAFNYYRMRTYVSVNCNKLNAIYFSTWMLTLKIK